MKDYTSNNITWDLSLRLRTHLTQNKYKKIVVLKLMLLLIEANHGQSIEQSCKKAAGTRVSPVRKVYHM